MPYARSERRKNYRPVFIVIKIIFRILMTVIIPLPDICTASAENIFVNALPQIPYYFFPDYN